MLKVLGQIKNKWQTRDIFYKNHIKAIYRSSPPLIIPFQGNKINIVLNVVKTVCTMSMRYKHATWKSFSTQENKKQQNKPKQD